MLPSFIWQSEDWIIFDWFSGHGVDMGVIPDYFTWLKQAPIKST